MLDLRWSAQLGRTVTRHGSFDTTSRNTLDFVEVCLIQHHDVAP